MADEILAEAFVNGAVQYLEAADQLCDLRYGPSHRTEGLDPVYLLYFHAVELALKGCLRSEGITTAELRSKGMGHELKTLFDRSHTLAAHLDGETRASVAGVVSLLDQGNVHQGFRYFTLVGRGMPELNWTREVAHILMEAARAIVPESVGSQSRMAVKMDMTAGKPVPKNRAAIG